MAITEETRHRLYQALERSIGPEEATTLMEHLPPVGWADVATKRDLEHLGATTRRDLELIETRLREHLERELRHTIVAALLGSSAITASALVAMAAWS